MPDPKQALKGKRILVCGGRRYGMPEKITEVDPQKRKPLLTAAHAKAQHEERFLYKVLTELAPVEVIAGDALGADRLAIEWARGYRVPYQVFKANWDLHRWAAGPIRNQEMHDETKPDFIVAFPGGKGTTSMCEIGKEAGTRIIRPVPGPDPVGDGYKITPFVRKLIVDLYGMRGYHCDTATKIYPEGIPEELQNECEAAHKKALVDQESELPTPIDDPVGKYKELFDRLHEARQERGGKLPEFLEELFRDSLVRYWHAMNEQEQARFEDAYSINGLAEHT